MNLVKIGDIIARKDMPSLRCEIIGEGNDWGGVWYVAELYVSPFKEDRARKKKKLFICKDDERWFIIKE